jgi:hypothetical protein
MLSGRTSRTLPRPIDATRFRCPTAHAIEREEVEQAHQDFSVRLRELW